MEKGKKRGRGALQREKKRARKESGNDNGEKNKGADATSKKQNLDDKLLMPKERKSKIAKPQKKLKIDRDDDALEDMIRSYKSSFSQEGLGDKASVAEYSNITEPKEMSREKVVTKRWFE